MQFCIIVILGPENNPDLSLGNNKAILLLVQKLQINLTKERIRV
jgi:hypothetical protein